MTIQNSDLEVISTASQWLRAGQRVDLVTVVRTWGSSPRPVGSLAVVREDGTLVGSVSGGCVEKQLAESFSRQRRNPDPQNQQQNQVVTHQIDDDQARKFGLTCGGQLELVFESLDESEGIDHLLEKIKRRERVSRTVDIGSGSIELRDAGADESFSYDGSSLKKVFGPDWRLLIIGAGQLSRYTAEFALALDYEVLVCDPRPEFRAAWEVDGTTLLDMSPDDAVLEHAVDSNSGVLALTHDPNLDDMALMEALPSKAFYIGALGSMKNYHKRVKRLEAIGLDSSDIAKLVGPIGLDIGSRTSAEIAISIVAHLVQVRSPRRP